MKKSFSNIIKPVKSILMITFVSAVLLTIVYKLTQNPIQQAQDKLDFNSIKNVITSEFNNNPFAEKINIRRDKDFFTLYPARKDGYITSIVMKESIKLLI